MRSGFQPGDSTVNQLVEMYFTLISSLAKKKVYNLFFVTFLRLLTNFSIMIIYLDRQQNVVIDGFTSKCHWPSRLCFFFTISTVIVY